MSDVMNDNTKPRYYPEINYLRGLAILAVIGTHVTAYFTMLKNVNALSITCMSIDALTSYAVPTFIFISGFVLYNKYDERFNIGEYYKKRNKSIIPQYISFSILYMVYSGKSLTDSLKNGTLFKNLLTGGAYYHLWFFVVIIELYVFYPLTLEIYNYFKNKNQTTVLLCITFVVGIIYNYYLRDFLILKQLQFLGFLFYFLFGIYIRQHYTSIDLKQYIVNYKYPIYFIIFLGISVSVIGSITSHFANTNIYFALEQLGNTDSAIWRLYNDIVSLVYCTILLICAFYISTDLSKSKTALFIDKIGTYSFVIYLVHAMILDKITWILVTKQLSVGNLFFYPYAYVLTLFISIIVVKILEAVPYSEYIIGKINYQ